MAGESLKKRRKELGFNIKEISDVLKIRTDYLTAIENNTFDILPVEIYTKGYIRCYAKHLDIDPEPVIQEYLKYLLQLKPTDVLPAVSTKKKDLNFFWLSGIFLVIVIASGYFIFYNITEKKIVTKKQNIANLPSIKFPDSLKESANNTQLPQLPALAANEHLLKISASETTWLYIKFSDDKSEEILLEPGHSKSWKFLETAFLKIGNTGGVRVDIDGKDIGLLGKSGQVKTLKIP